jgi:uncharacterized LabA/DUF88 family protein
MKEERVSVFIDGSNFYHILKGLFPDEKPMNFKFERLIDYLIRDRRLINVFYYNAPLDREKDEQGYRKQQQFFDKITHLPKFNLILCRMQKVKIDGKIIYQVKEDDIHLAVDMVKFGYKDIYDTAILISSDGDFVPAIKIVKEIGKNIENVGFENKFSYHLKQECDRFIKLTKDKLKEFFD